MHTTLLAKKEPNVSNQQQSDPLCARFEAGANHCLTERRHIPLIKSRLPHYSKRHCTDSYAVHAGKAVILADEMDVPYMFRYRRPPKGEVYVKLIILLAFGVFCAFVGLNVAYLPLPSSKRGADSIIRTNADEVLIFPIFSSEERIKLPELSSRIAVPYLMPWGEDERPAMFFMWHLLYRSIKPDLDHFEAELRNTPGVNNTSLLLGGSASQDVLKVVIDVVEAHGGYITTSLAHFLPSAYVFSIVASAPPAQHNGRSRARARDTRGSYSTRAENLTAECRAYAEKVAAKVERVLADPSAEQVVEASQQPCRNGVQPIQPTNLSTTTSERGAVASGAAGMNTAERRTENATSARLHPHLYLCVPQQDLNFSYYANTAAQGLRVNYQVILHPYVALRGARTATEFDAALRALLAQANVASFIALPWVSEKNSSKGDHLDQGEPALRRRVLLDQELKDYERWYDSVRLTPLEVLQRALSGPAMQNRYRVSVMPLGSKRWFWALRELFRVELVEKHDERAASLTARLTTITANSAGSTAAAALAAAGASRSGMQASLPRTSVAAKTFGCTSRVALLGCVARTQHSSCEQFTE
ncbi:hypothetical protein GH5_03119 [Leishmania sp. Ghana 2012 LV757]|uniref:hypothetical protein n=1 Tax=Leishmania sp. Ghana 2012 LV757 TaxID=2803181 RepID=UPI001B45C65B|nr:hypothetical protein GH5_03119 [Leishmania sp. Ghana 2012 LV757]